MSVLCYACGGHLEVEEYCLSCSPRPAVDPAEHALLLAVAEAAEVYLHANWSGKIVGSVPSKRESDAWMALANALSDLRRFREVR